MMNIWNIFRQYPITKMQALKLAQIRQRRCRAVVPVVTTVYSAINYTRYVLPLFMYDCTYHNCFLKSVHVLPIASRSTSRQVLGGGGEHIYICRHCYSHSSIQLHTYIHTYIHPCIRAYIQTYIHANIHTCTHTCIDMHTYVHTCIYIYVCMYIIWQKVEQGFSAVISACGACSEWQWGLETLGSLREVPSPS